VNGWMNAGFDMANQQASPKQPAQEWGERQEHGKTVARGGHDHGHVPGAMGQRT